MKEEGVSCYEINSNYLFLATYNGEIGIFNFSGEIIKRYDLHELAINNLNLNKTGKYIASCSNDGKSIILELLKEEKTIYDFEQPVRNIALNPKYPKNNKMFVVGLKNGDIILHSETFFKKKSKKINDGKKDQVEKTDERIFSLNWKRDYIIWVTDRGLTVYNIITNTKLNYNTIQSKFPKSIFFKSFIKWRTNNSFLVCWECSIKLFQIHSSNKLRLLYSINFDSIISGIIKFNKKYLLLTVEDEEYKITLQKINNVKNKKLDKNEIEHDKKQKHEQERGQGQGQGKEQGKEQGQGQEKGNVMVINNKNSRDNKHDQNDNTKKKKKKKKYKGDKTKIILEKRKAKKQFSPVLQTLTIKDLKFLSKEPVQFFNYEDCTSSDYHLITINHTIFVVSPHQIIYCKKSRPVDNVEWLTREKQYEQALKILKKFPRSFKPVNYQKIGIELINKHLEMGMAHRKDLEDLMGNGKGRRNNNQKKVESGNNKQTLVESGNSTQTMVESGNNTQKEVEREINKQMVAEREMIQNIRSDIVYFSQNDANNWMKFLDIALNNNLLSNILDLIPLEMPVLPMDYYEKIVLFLITNSSWDDLTICMKSWDAKYFQRNKILATLKEIVKKSQPPKLINKIIYFENVSIEDQYNDKFKKLINFGNNPLSLINFSVAKLKPFICLLDLYLILQQYYPALAIMCLFKGKNPYYFIENNKFFLLPDSFIILLMFYDPIKSSDFFLKHIEKFPINKIVHTLQCYENNQRKNLYHYLYTIYRKSPDLCQEYHFLLFELSAEYNIELINNLLNVSTNIPLKRALKICNKYQYHKQSIKILEIMGNGKKAISSILNKLEDLQYAIYFAKNQKDPVLWENIIKYSLKNPKLLSLLLDLLPTTGLDFLDLLDKIPKNLQIRNLKEKIKKIIIDKQLQVDVFSLSNIILKNNSWEKFSDYNENLNLGRYVSKNKKCMICRKKINQCPDMFTLFYCNHAYHNNCLKEKILYLNNNNSPNQNKMEHNSKKKGKKQKKKQNTKSLIDHNELIENEKKHLYCLICKKKQIPIKKSSIFNEIRL